MEKSRFRVGEDAVGGDGHGRRRVPCGTHRGRRGGPRRRVGLMICGRSRLQHDTKARGKERLEEGRIRVEGM